MRDKKRNNQVSSSLVDFSLHTRVKLGSNVPSEENLIDKYKNDQDKLCMDHERLIERILEDEEKLIKSHKGHIDKHLSIVKQEMALLNGVE